ncbi:unnamed protein product, partial [Amoebophrya sp. A120]
GRTGGAAAAAGETAERGHHRYRRGHRRQGSEKETPGRLSTQGGGVPQARHRPRLSGFEERSESACGQAGTGPGAEVFHGIQQALPAARAHVFGG